MNYNKLMLIGTHDSCAYKLDFKKSFFNAVKLLMALIVLT